MPTYQYKCLKCGEIFEALLPMGHTEKPKCLECGHHETQKLLSAPAVIFKGSGFYITDSRKPSKKKLLSPKKEEKKLPRGKEPKKLDLPKTKKNDK